MIMLALATLSTTTTAPRTRATTTSLGPRSSTLWGPTTTWGQEGAVDSYNNEHGIHAAPQQHGSESGRQAAEAGLGQAESVRSSACGCEGAGTVPSGVAIGPTGGRGASPLGGALTLKHKMEPHRSQERAAVRSPGVKRGSMEAAAQEGASERHWQPSGCAERAAYGGTAMLPAVQRECAAEVWGTGGSNAVVKNVEQKTRERDAKRKNKKNCGDHGKRKGSRQNILLASPVLCEKVLKARQSLRVKKSFFTVNRSRKKTHQPPQRAGKKTPFGTAKRVKKSRGKNPAANMIKEKKAPPPWNLPTKKIMNSLAGGGTKRWPPKAPPRKRWRWEFDPRTRRSTAPQHARKKPPRRRRQRGVGRARRKIDTTHRRKGRNR